MIKKCFIDSDIILDVLTQRENFYQPAAELLDLGFAKKLNLFTTALVLANVFYIIRKKYGTEKSKEQLKKLRLLMKVLPISEKAVDEALASEYRDFEDSLQYFTARENGIPVIITRNKKDYRGKDVTAQSAEEYIRINS